MSILWQRFLVVIKTNIELNCLITKTLHSALSEI